MENFDLIIVGTGFASSFFLKKYLEKSPETRRILILERGVFFPYTERIREAKHEKPSKEFTNIVSDQQTYHYDNPNKTWAFDPNFGGSSNCWTGCTPRFMPNDFKIKTLYGVGQDWPISYNDIEPYYTEAEDIMMIGGPLITPFPRSKAYPLPPQKLSTVDKLLQAKYKELYISQPTARATIATGKRNGCCSSSVCQLCPVNAKFTIENTLSYLYEDPRVTIKYSAIVFNLIVENNKVKGVAYKMGGREYEAGAEVVALGANAIFNAHILLAAGDKNYYTGRGLSDQRGTYVYFNYSNLDNLGGSSIISANGYMLYDGLHRKDYAACFIEHFNDPIIRNEPGKWRKISKFKFVFEDLPNNNNRVLLSDDPLMPKVEYHSHDHYVDRAMGKLKENINKTFASLPIEGIEMDNYFQKSEFHICSTTRMGESEKTALLIKI